MAASIKLAPCRLRRAPVGLSSKAALSLTGGSISTHRDYGPARSAYAPFGHQPGQHRRQHVRLCPLAIMTVVVMTAVLADLKPEQAAELWYFPLRLAQLPWVQYTVWYKCW